MKPFPIASSSRTTACFTHGRKRQAVETGVCKTLELEHDLASPTAEKDRLLKIEASQQQVRYAANGRDTRIQTVKLGPYLAYEAVLRPNQLCRGENVLEVAAARLQPSLVTKINLAEIELRIAHA